MKHYFIHKQESSQLTLFLAGWGMDHRPFIDCHPERSDLLVCYDYRSLDFDTAWLDGYECIRLVGWSMGVWAASRLPVCLDVRITDRIAVNGTLTPVDDDKGIPRSIFEGTLDGLNEASLRKFIRRMCGSGEALGAFMEKRPQRPVEELKEELRLIGGQAAVLPDLGAVWSKAVVGRQDLIFTAANQRRAWSESGTDVVEADVPHYSETLLRQVLLGQDLEGI